ncbi:MAG: YqiA/YcfP family alpha/beta fold hydrolase [Candidatus Cryptobacteroides sp.]|jgi:predicted esterase YcpF (UPF0227 family)|nr:YqiA/YcfP family alpha/beta fold hydrolase [Candidatus Cryptobacteroides sp.]
MKILFIHGLASSGAYKMASTLRILIKGSEVISPDVPIEPDEALDLLEGICRDEDPDLVVGLSLGGFWAQKLRGRRKILINPDFHISALLESMMGEVKYLSPRADGAEYFSITQGICDGYRKLEEGQFKDIGPEEAALTTGIFADRDEMVDCRPEFELHYPGRSHVYPGTHLPDYPHTKRYILPVILNEIPEQHIH